MMPKCPLYAPIQIISRDESCLDCVVGNSTVARLRRRFDCERLRPGSFHGIAKDCIWIAGCVNITARCHPRILHASEMNAVDFDKLSDEEKEHFFQCPKCGEFVDTRELRDVIFHVTDHKPKPHIPRIKGKPIPKRPSGD
jgi:uncharacterized C2H2 Zn-finger protein